MSFYKFNEAKMKNQIYFTIIYRCNYSSAYIAAIADKVLDQFMKDIPGVKNLYTNSENAGFYHGTYSPEPIYILC